MKLIQKSKEPNYLQEHRGLDGTDYQSFSRDVGLGEIEPLSGLRALLLSDQGFICAYCMRRIPHKFIEKEIEKDDFKIEHYINQKSKSSIDAKLDISYANMFACCMGNEGQKEKFQTCDTRKGEKVIKITPIDLAHIRTLKYAPDGSIHSTNADFEEEITKCLNLNEDKLRLQREAIYGLVAMMIKKNFTKPHLTRSQKNKLLDDQIERWSQKRDGKFSEFCMVAVTYLESRKR